MTSPEACCASLGPASAGDPLSCHSLATGVVGAGRSPYTRAPRLVRPSDGRRPPLARFLDPSHPVHRAIDALPSWSAPPGSGVALGEPTLAATYSGFLGPGN